MVSCGKKYIYNGYGRDHGIAYLTGKLWSGLILSNKLYSCESNVCKLG